MTNQEKKVFIRYLKDNSGTHSPSISTILDVVGEDTISIDACFLSNPYATELFIKNLNLLIQNEKKQFDVSIYLIHNITK